MAELGISYQHADLIIRLQERLKKLKGKFSVSDGVEIHYKWKEDWIRYLEEQAKNDAKTS
jgi:predicted CopG family antitoxin